MQVSYQSHLGGAQRKRLASGCWWEWQAELDKTGFLREWSGGLPDTTQERVLYWRFEGTCLYMIENCILSSILTYNRTLKLPSFESLNKVHSRRNEHASQYTNITFLSDH